MILYVLYLVPYTWAHQPAYTGRDTEQTVSAKDSKEDEMLSRT
ncbi:hypothetical protein M126_4635 [Bacteroides fragilis str. S6L3]|nr:hypothetical protein M074_4496 [Bacteroides fragilis str. DS-166]EYA02591.1 hypothetical protein M126_4635 [Bacteroides fragilis str. S6L3]EYA07175.1 hypothetical protein M130_4625 [Bacteroides fragilis str. S6R6]EYA82579.1 hypothetical protein M137_5654 [Bacteroides fragilis str. S36L12]EYE48805.1 hypothetical protein M131_4516 [Bacteroides fragilis str. S6R8]